MKKTLIVLALIAVATGGYYAWQRHAQPQSSSQTDSPAPRGGKGGDGARRPLAPVQAATATRQCVPQYHSGLGTVTAVNTATVRSRVNGDLLAIHFTEGQQVNAGDLLAEVDPRPYQVA